MKDLTTTDFFKQNEFYEFIKNTFKEGTVPQDEDDFMACFSNNTTDGSLCFANQFGKGEDDAVMLFFYPTFCAVPPRYNKNLRNQEECNIGLVVLEYQKLIAKHTNKLSYLEVLKEDMERRNDGSRLMMEFHMERIFRQRHFDGEVNAEKSPEEIVKSYQNLSSKYEEVKIFVEERIATLKDESEYDFSEVTTPQEEPKRLK